MFNAAMSRIPGPGTRWVLLALLASCLGAISCGGSSHLAPQSDGAAGNGGRDGGADVPVDSRGNDVRVGPDSSGIKIEGAACGAAGECASGFCFDGVCCRTDCSTACWSCSVQGSVGVCIPAEVGTDPRNDCPDDGLSSCGRDGACDGSGACRRYPTGAICRQPSCGGSTLTLASRCEAGTCTPTSGLPCDPYICDPQSGTACLKSCTTNAQCGAGNVCNNGSCGKAPIGAACGTGDDCNSNICQQGRCCDRVCNGNCFSCAVPQSEGTCTAVPAGTDPLGQCAAGDASTCATDGFCDGKGGCELYSAATVCAPPTCAGSTGTAPAHCNGTGVCGTGAALSCKEYLCNTDGTCRTSCRTTADCSAGNVCSGNGGTCGKKPLGALCSLANECASNACQWGVCCDRVCTGDCMACNVAGIAGTCSAVPVGPAPTGQCPVDPSNSCGNDGTCDGAGSCHLRSSGTICKPSTCTAATETLAGVCNGAGACGVGTTQMCAPFQCDTNGACRQTCGVDGDCTTGNVCSTLMSCGKKPPGATCAAAAECGSNFCEQGVCCTTACTGTCKSCAIAGSAGTCSNVPAGGSDPGARCATTAAATCGTDGTCNGGGACRLYGAATQCAAASCTGSTLTTKRTCSGTGAGVCQAATVSTCPGGYTCDTANNVCKITCTTSADCVSPLVCSGGICAGKPLGTTCGVAAECASNFCQQGVCCSSACTGTCMSCALPGATTLGICSNVPAGGTDPGARCATTAAATCGTDGTCNGAGACTFYSATTPCGAGSCPANTSLLTAAQFCDGAGHCPAGATSHCDPFLCGANAACKNSCTVATSAADCVAPNVCNGTLCGKKPTGATCASGAECNSTFCTEGFCCDKACSGTCQSCAVAGKQGTCSSIAAGSPPVVASQCLNQGATSCGTDGTCDGSNNCRLFATGTQCVASSCSTGSTLVSARSCNGTGSCQAATSGPCPGGFFCNTGSSVCKTSCTIATSAADCVSPNVCTGNLCGVLKLQYESGGVTATMTTSPHPHFQIVNLGTAVIPLSDLTIRYWFTGDGAQTQVGVIDYAANSANVQVQASVTTTFTAVTRTGADFYMEVGFAAAAGNLAASGGTTVVHSRFNSTNPNFGINYTQPGDYSFDATKTAFTDWTNVTLYQRGTRVWGIEPPSM
jgi:hypothetical protein